MNKTNLSIKIFRIIRLIITFILIFPICYLPIKRMSHHKRKKYIKDNKKFKSKKEHTAILIIDNHKSKFKIIEWAINYHNELIYDDKIDKLIKYFIDNNKPYEVYQSINENKFKEIINDKKIPSVFIFGHGAMTGVIFGQFPEKFLSYKTFINSPKKKYIAQYHCNSGDRLFLEILNEIPFCTIPYNRGKSLKKIMNAKGFDKPGLLTPKDVNEDINKIISGRCGI